MDVKRQDIRSRQLLAYNITSLVDPKETPPLLSSVFNPTRSRVSSNPSAKAVRFTVKPIPVVPVEEDTETQDDFRVRTLTLGLRLAIDSIAKTSKKTYSTGWNHWIHWSSVFGVDLYLRNKPPLWQSQFGCHFPASFEIAAVVSFLAYLFGHVKIKPSSIDTYLFGVKYMLQLSGIDTTYIDKNVMIRRMRAGMTLRYRFDHPEHLDTTMPFTLEMIMFAHNHLDHFNPHNLMAVVAMKLAFCCLMRASECIQMPNSDHHLLAENVTFIHVIDHQEVWIPSYLVLSSSVSLLTLSEVIIDVRSAKNDKTGSGNRLVFAHTPLATRPNTQAFDIAEVLWSFCLLSCPVVTKPFFCYKNREVLKYFFFESKIKEIADRSGFDMSRFSSHSLRVAGASTLAALGYPDYVIQKMGRWNSQVFLRYIHLLASTYNKAVVGLTTYDTLSIQSVRKLMPLMDGPTL